MTLEQSAGACIYRIDNGRPQILFLLQKSGRLDTPKGHVERGESLEEAAKREIFEESGLKVEFLPHFKEEIRYFVRKGKRKIPKLVTLFLAKMGGGKVKISHEHKAYKWLDLDGALELNTFKDLERHLRRMFEYVGRLERMEELNREYASLPSKHRDWDLSKTFVPGDGPLDAKIMLIGQAPGANEDILKKPFVGRSGKVLDRMFKTAGLSREKIYITSCVQFFPPKNRGPTDREIAECKQFLMRQIAIVKPKSVILVGNFATNNLLGFDKVSQNHGKSIKKDGVSYFITFHPAMALRSSKKVAALMEQDFKLLKERLLS
ncbi:MAG: NUDIX domain-containing protein [Candidatus Micrarchaeota archaeon]|nr:NUDIX domain-containing protein [Candidatus Micrarchaeota archaeon]